MVEARKSKDEDGIYRDGLSEQSSVVDSVSLDSEQEEEEEETKHEVIPMRRQPDYAVVIPPGLQGDALRQFLDD